MVNGHIAKQGAFPEHILLKHTKNVFLDIYFYDVGITFILYTAAFDFVSKREENH